jgi:hypothetical protein
MCQMHGGKSREGRNTRNETEQPVFSSPDTYPIHRSIKEPMLETTTFSSRSHKPAADRDARKLHHDWRQQPTPPRLPNKHVHGHVGLYQRDFAFDIDAQDAIEGADVDDGVPGEGRVPSTVCATMVDAEGG